MTSFYLRVKEVTEVLSSELLLVFPLFLLFLSLKKCGNCSLTEHFTSSHTDLLAYLSGAALKDKSNTVFAVFFFLPQFIDYTTLWHPRQMSPLDNIFLSRMKILRKENIFSQILIPLG